MLSSENVIPIPSFVKWVSSYLIQSIFWLCKKASHFQWLANPPPTFHSLPGLLMVFMFSKVKKKVIQVLRGKNLLIYIISACYDMVTPAHTADFFLCPKEEFFFPFKNTFLSRKKHFWNKHFHIKWKLRTMAFLLLFPPNSWEIGLVSNRSLNASNVLSGLCLSLFFVFYRNQF